MKDLLQELDLPGSRNQGAGILTSIRQPTNMDGRNSLVFVYPMLIDATLDKKYGGLLRDFFTAYFMSSIKQSNVLNITAKVSPSVGTGDRMVNPAESLRDNLSRSSPQTTGIRYADHLHQQDQRNFASQQQADYQLQIDQFRSFIVDQVKIDPKYADLRPLISSLTLENLLTIPMVLGTKSFKVHNGALYWILFMAIGRNLKMNSMASLTRIKEEIRNIPVKNYADLLVKGNDADMQPAKYIKDERALVKFVNQVDDQVDVTLRRFDIVLSERNWSDEVGVMGVGEGKLSTSSSSAISNTMGIRENLRRRALSLFSSFLGNYVIGLLQSTANSLVASGTEINITKKLQKFAEDVYSHTDITFYNLVDYITVGLGDQTTTGGADILINQAQSMCQANTKIDVRLIFNKISGLTVTLTGAGLAEFVEGLSRESSKLATFSTQLEQNIFDLSGSASGLEKTLKNYKKAIKTETIKFFTHQDQVEVVDHRGRPTGATRTEPAISPPGRITNAGRPTRFFQLTGQADETQFLSSIYDGITEIVYFTALYTLFSYMCDYFAEIQADIQTQKRDALDFPNYCLVIPSYMIEGWYAALAAKKFQDLMSDDPEIVKAAKHNININEKVIMRMIMGINERLFVPNLMVIDESKKEVYIKLMFQRQVMKLSLSTLQNYVRHQSDALPGF